MQEKRTYITRTYNLSPGTEDKIKAISRENHSLSFGKVIDWSVETLFEELFGTKEPEPITEREELDRR